MSELVKDTGMYCHCGATLWIDAKNEIYICSECGQPEEECECE